MKNELLELNPNTIKDKIYIIRNQKVMLDSDLAEIYGYNLSAFNQQVQRNIEKFDKDFMFQLNNEEYLNLKSQFVTSSWGGKRKLPYAFTEQGIYMLMTVLKGKLAVKQSKALIRLFKEMKDFILENEKRYVEYKDFAKLSIQTNKNTEAIKQIEKNMITKQELMKFIKRISNKKNDKEILILNGKQVESDMAYQKIYSEANHSIYIVDNYISLKTLVLLKNINPNVGVTIFTDNINKGLHKLEYNDFSKEYKNIKINFKKTNGKYHDRYIIIDHNKRTEKIYHCGASSKDSGKRITSINKIKDKKIYKEMIENLLKNKTLILT